MQVFVTFSQQSTGTQLNENHLEASDLTTIGKKQDVKVTRYNILNVQISSGFVNKRVFICFNMLSIDHQQQANHVVTLHMINNGEEKAWS